MSEENSMQDNDNSVEVEVSQELEETGDMAAVNEVVEQPKSGSPEAVDAINYLTIEPDHGSATGCSTRGQEVTYQMVRPAVQLPINSVLILSSILVCSGRICDLAIHGRLLF